MNYDKYAILIWISILIFLYSIILPGCGSNKHTFATSKSYMKQLDGKIAKQEAEISEYERIIKEKDDLINFYKDKVESVEALADLLREEYLDYQLKLQKSSDELAECKEKLSSFTDKAIYEVVAVGDWLSSIAYNYYGNIVGWVKLWEANSENVSNPDLIYPGQVLCLPVGDLTAEELIYGAKVHNERYN